MGVIVVATDGSAAANAALETALGIAAKTADEISVVTVWRALQGDYGLAYPSGAVLDDILVAEREHAEGVLEQARETALRAGVSVATHLLTGDPAQCICAFANDADARLVAMGTHGYGSVLALIVGSVSSDVIKHAPCPVLVVRAPAGAAEDKVVAAGNASTRA
jgi:nucleotide-binding universal stress UspA family protein